MEEDLIGSRVPVTGKQPALRAWFTHPIIALLERKEQWCSTEEELQMEEKPSGR